jgi:hypothetical protein
MKAPTARSTFSVPAPRPTGYAAMGIAAALCVWLIATHDGGTQTKTIKIGPSSSAATTSRTTPTQPSSLSAAQLAAGIRAVGHPVYWAGADAGTGYDLTRETSGITIVRYVLSTTGSESLRVATIPYRNAYAATKDLASKPGAVSRSLPNGSLVYYRTTRPSAYVVFPGVDYVIEVDAPSPAQARKVALSGRIAPIG